MILVVGGAGYIGSHMLKLLREANEPHVAFDNLENGHREGVQESLLFEGDLRNPDDLSRAFDAYPEIDLVMHFAAYISVGESVREPGKYYRNNTAGVLNLLEEMRKREIGKFVFSSTAAVFGNPQYVPLDEDHPKGPLNPYGWSKLMVEQMLDDYDVAHEFKSVCLRYFNAAGSDPAAILGEDHHPEEHLIPVALLAALGKRPTMKIFGTDYDTPDGTCVRDYVHVLDLAQAQLLAIRHLRSGGDSRKYNLGNGEGFSVKQVLETAEKVIGREIPKEYGPRRPGDSPRLVANSARIRQDWGWQPRYTDLAEIIEHAWKWRLAHLDGF